VTCSWPRPRSFTANIARLYAKGQVQGWRATSGTTTTSTTLVLVDSARLRGAVMDTSTAARPLSTDPIRPIPDTHLELRWRVRDTRGRASTLAAEWVLVGNPHERREAA
jgi:hypothetical protein